MADDGVGLSPFQTAQYTSNVQLLLQQQGSMLRSHVDSKADYVGKMASPVNQVGAVSMQTPAGRFAPKNRTDASLTRRWVFPEDKELDQLIDSFDELKTIVDPKSVYVTNTGYAAGRAWDDCIIRQATAINYLGTDIASLTTETFDTTKFRIADTFGASATAGLIVSKMIEAQRILRKYHNELERDPPVWITSSQGEADLLGQVEVVSTEFNDRPVLVEGRVKRFLGFDIVVMERLPIYTTNVRGNLVWVRSGMHLGIWKDLKNRVSIRNDLSSEPWDLYTQISFGACRTQPGKLLQVGCADTTGADITP